MKDKILLVGGGHYVAVNPWFIVHPGGDDDKIIITAREVNTYKTEWVIEKIQNEALKFEAEHGKKTKVACMGLAFKANIDDLIESPALYIAQKLANELENVVCVEPNINNSQLVSIEDAMEADIITFLVGHDEFKGLDIKTNLDFCGVLN